jgi:hypothetical protein
MIDYFPNACSTYKISLTTLVKDAYAKSILPKLKLIKFYLRSIMPQEG